MALKEVLAKLTLEDKWTILVDLVILPAIEEDKSLSQEEKGDIFRAAAKMGLPQAEVEAAIKKQLAAVGAVEEK